MKKLSLTAAVAFLMASFSAVGGTTSEAGKGINQVHQSFQSSGYLLVKNGGYSGVEMLVCPAGKTKNRVKKYSGLFACSDQDDWDGSAEAGTEVPAVTAKDELARQLGPNFVFVGVAPIFGINMNKVVIYYKKK